MKTKTINLLILCVSIFSCEKEKETKPVGKKENQPNYEIYYRWEEDLNCPGSSPSSLCRESMVPYYNNSHPDIPDNAVKSIYYGNVSPGHYTIVIPREETGTTVTLSRTLIAPQVGFRRYYTDSLKSHNNSVNRCTFHMGNSGLSYTDEPI